MERAFVIQLPDTNRNEERLVCMFCATNHTLTNRPGEVTPVTFEGQQRCSNCGALITATSLTTEQASKRLLAMYDSGIKNIRVKVECRCGKLIRQSDDGEWFHTASKNDPHYCVDGFRPQPKDAS